MFADGIFVFMYFIPLVWFADTVGIPSKTADRVVFKYSKRIHYMKNGLDTKVFVPRKENYFECDEMDSVIPSNQIPSAPLPLPVPRSLLPVAGNQSTSTPLTRSQSVDPAFTLAETVNGPTMVYIGRLAVEKNIEFLIASLKDPALANASLIIIGDGPIRARLESLAIEVVGADMVYSKPDSLDASTYKDLVDTDNVPTMSHGIVDGRRYNVVFGGMIFDEKVISAHYACADVFVSTSGSETFGFTVAEAIACGIPVCVVRSGAFASVFRMMDGWMFEEENVEDFAGRVVRVYKDGVGARRFAQWVAVKEFSVESAIRDSLRTYEWCLDGDGEGKD
ncbi:Sulfoquinovosyl transferase sqd2 [Blyttiomyces sp. JEL0837]|nr:Sulfoquinovosyl transferase sqd2 [Blyttiomyces sp. JEL0837]